MDSRSSSLWDCDDVVVSQHITLYNAMLASMVDIGYHFAYKSRGRDYVIQEVRSNHAN